MTVRTAAQQQVMVKERKWQSSSGELKHLSVYISSRFVSINTNWYIFTKLQVYLEGWQKANALFTRPAIPAGRAACSSVGMRCLMAEWDRRLPCGCWWRLSCECCTSLHPPGWTGRSPWEQDLVWKRSPLEGGKRRATRSQLQTCGNHFCLLLFRTLQAHTREQCDRDSECYWISQHKLQRWSVCRCWRYLWCVLLQAVQGEVVSVSGLNPLLLQRPMRCQQVLQLRRQMPLWTSKYDITYCIYIQQHRQRQMRSDMDQRFTLPLFGPGLNQFIHL